MSFVAGHRQLLFAVRTSWLTDITPHAKSNRNVVHPDDRVYSANEVGDGEPRNEGECSYVASSPMPWKRKQDEHDSQEGRNRELVVMTHRVWRE